MSSKHLYGWQHSRFHEILVGLSRNSYFLVRVVWSLKHMYCLLRIVMSANSRFSKSFFFSKFFFFRVFFSPRQFFSPSFLRFLLLFPQQFSSVFMLHSQCQKSSAWLWEDSGNKSLGFFFSHFEPQPILDLWFGSDDVPLNKKGGWVFRFKMSSFRVVVTNIYHTNQLLIEGKYTVRHSSHVNFAGVFVPGVFSLAKLRVLPKWLILVGSMWIMAISIFFSDLEKRDISVLRKNNLNLQFGGNISFGRVNISPSDIGL